MKRITVFIVLAGMISLTFGQVAVEFPECAKENDVVVLEELAKCDGDITYSSCGDCVGRTNMQIEVMAVVGKRPMAIRKHSISTGAGNLNFLKTWLLDLADDGTLAPDCRVVFDFKNVDDKMALVSVPLKYRGTYRINKGIEHFKKNEFQQAYELFESMMVNVEYIGRLKVFETLAKKDTNEFLKVYKPKGNYGSLPVEEDMNPLETFLKSLSPDFVTQMNELYVNANLIEARKFFEQGIFSKSKAAANKILKAKQDFSVEYLNQYTQLVIVLIQSLEQSKTKKEIKEMGYLEKYVNKAESVPEIEDFKKKYKW